MDDLPLLRSALDSHYAAASGAEIDAVVQSIYGEAVTAEDVEGLFSDIGRGLQGAARGIGQFARQAAPVLSRAAPSVLAGAATGSALGPWGALIGAGAGLAGGILSQSRNSTARAVGSGIGQAGGLVSAVRGGGPAGALGALASVGGGIAGQTPQGRALRATMAGRAPAQGQVPTGMGAAGGSSANALAGLLARPELLQSLLSSLLGSAGRRQVPVGGQDIPVHQMLGTLSTVARRAASEAAEFDPNADHTSPGLLAASEALGMETEDAESRADAVLTMLALAPSIWNRRDPPMVIQIPAPSAYDAGEAWWDPEADDIEQAEWDGEDEESWEFDEGTEPFEDDGFYEWDPELAHV